MANTRAEQDAKMSSLFHSQDSFKEQHCARTLSSSALGRAGVGMLPAPIIIDHDTADVAVVKAINDALQAGSLSKLHQAWAEWISAGNADVPLNNRDLNKVQQRAVRIGVWHLREAMSSRDVARVRELVQAVDVAVARWPCPLGIKASLEYQSARQLLSDADALEEKSDATRDAGLVVEETFSLSLGAPLRRRSQESQVA
mmetsp:Transcript_55512/g.141131  ORF Transcript_55512/g.141131 Transcript_55512/m.141131 type:complete len:200 (+) Transcript_55512:55-654(+)